MSTLRPSPLDERRTSSNPDLMNADNSTQFAKSRKRKQVALPKSKHLDLSDSEDVPTFRTEMMSLITTFKEDNDKRIDLLTSAIQEMTAQNKEILKLHEKFQKMFEQTTAAHRENKAMFNAISSEHKKALIRIGSLEEQVEELQRNQRSSILELKNVPKKEEENLIDIASKLHSSLGVNVEAGSIKNVHRNNNAKVSSIVIEYHNQQIRNHVIKASKEYNKTNRNSKLNSAMLGFPNKEPVYVNELLTPNARKLYAQARALVKNGRVKFCWLANGKILVRISENEPAMQVKSCSQIEALQNDQCSSIS